jgi:hypothetical protein
MENALQALRNRAARLRAVRRAALNAMKESREAPTTNLDTAEMQPMLPADKHVPQQGPTD